MSDTVSASATAASAPGGLTFLAPDSLSPATHAGFDHVPGGGQDTPAAPAQLFSFVTLTPDFKGLLPVQPMPDSVPATIGSLVTIPSGARTTIVDFDHHGLPPIVTDT